MKRFEYQTLFYDQGPPAECRHLNRLGDDGWEAYATAVQGTRLTIFLKRERAKEREMLVDTNVHADALYDKDAFEMDQRLGSSKG